MIDREGMRALVDAGYAPLSEYVAEMGAEVMSEHQIKEHAEEAVASAHALASAQPGVFVNGFSFTFIGRDFTRVTFAESVAPNLPAIARAAVVVPAGHLAMLARACVQVALTQLGAEAPEVNEMRAELARLLFPVEAPPATEPEHVTH